MNEGEWLKSEDPQAMLALLQGSGRASVRKLRLLAVACCRRIWPLLDVRSGRRAVEVAERFADGLASGEEEEDALKEAGDAYEEVMRLHEGGRFSAPDAIGYHSAQAAYYTIEGRDFPHALRYALMAAVHHECDEVEEDAGRDAAEAAESTERAAQAALLRCLFGPTPFRQVNISPSILTRRECLIPGLAQEAYQERTVPAGHLDSGRLAVVADALLDAGCTDASLLDHLRNPGPHTRGCWVIDLLTGRD